MGVAASAWQTRGVSSVAGSSVFGRKLPTVAPQQLRKTFAFRKMRGVLIFGISALVISFVMDCAESGCESNRLRQGCRIQEGRCLCGTGCDTDYRYSNRKECEAALRGTYNVFFSFRKKKIIISFV